MRKKPRGGKGEDAEKKEAKGAATEASASVQTAQTAREDNTTVAYGRAASNSAASSKEKSKQHDATQGI